MSKFYGLEGEPITMEEWSSYYAGDQSKRIIGRTQIGEVRVSTVHLGLDHSFLGGPPLIFETMVFGPEELIGEDNPMERYATKEQAAEGHARMVAEWTEKINGQG